MSLNPLPATTGTSLITTKTALSIIGALLLHFAPAAFQALGITNSVDQAQAIELVKQIGEPSLLLLAIVFRGVASKKVTSILPKASSGTATLHSIFVALVLPALLFLCMAGASVSLSACAASTPRSHLQEGRATAAAWHALDQTAQQLTGLANANIIHGQDAATAKTALDDATVALTAADAAYHAGRAADAQTNVARATALIAQVVAIIQRNVSPAGPISMWSTGAVVATIAVCAPENFGCGSFAPRLLPSGTVVALYGRR